MSESFFSELAFHWTLYQNMFAQGILIAVTLSLTGVLVVARNQIFTGAAISAASTLGIALALVLAQYSTVHHHTPDDDHATNWYHSDSFKTTMAVISAVAASLIVVGRGRSRNAYEARIGWIFLVSTVGANLLVAKSPHSLEEIHRVHYSSILGAAQSENVLLALVAMVTLLVLAATWRGQLLLATDPEMASSSGMRASLWQWIYAIWLAICIGLAIRFSGLLYTFGMLVLPALIARSCCHTMRAVLIASPIVALGATLLVFVPELIPGWSTGYPSEQLAVFLLGVALLPAWCYQQLRLRWQQGRVSHR